MHRLVGQLAHDVVELARRYREGTGLFDDGRLQTTDADFEIRRGELELSVLLAAGCGEQDVREDRHGVPLLDDGLKTSESSLQVALLDHELHDVSPLLLLFQVFGKGVMVVTSTDKPTEVVQVPG